MKKALKVLSVVLVVAMLGSLLVACGGGSDETSPAASDAAASPAASDAVASPAAAEPVSLKVVTYMTGSDAWAGAWKEVQKAYMDANKNVTLVDESVPAANDQFKNKVNTDFAAGNEPDVTFGFTGADSKAMVDSAKVLAWDDELKNDTAWAGGFSQGALEGVRYTDGKIYGLPYIGYFEGMFYNQELFDKNSVKVPTNYDELLKAVDAFKAKNIVPITVSFAEEPHYLIETFVLSLGGKAGHTAPFDASWAPALNCIKELYTKGAFPKDALTIKSAAASQLFNDEKAAMFISGSWSAGGMKDPNGKFDVSAKAKVMPLPMLPNGKADPSDIIAGFGSGWYVSKAKSEANVKASTAFVKWLTTKDQLAKFIAVGGVPALKDIQVATATGVQTSGFAMMGAAKTTDTPIDSKIKPEAFKTIWKGLSQLVTGKKTAEQLLEEAKKLN